MPARRMWCARPTPRRCADDQWAEFLYLRTNPKGRHVERWRHVHGCARFFNCVRDTVTDKIEDTYRSGEPGPGRVEGAETRI